MAGLSESELFEENHRPRIVGDCERFDLRRRASDATCGEEEEDDEEG